jgi:hypothetical protein
MRRRHFLLISAVISFLIAIGMFADPSTFLNDATPGSNPLGEFMVRATAIGLFTLGLINLMARRDGWSDSMKAILIGNTAYHFLSISLDIYGYLNGLLGTRAAVSGLVIHSIMLVGFMVMLVAPSRQDEIALQPNR